MQHQKVKTTMQSTVNIYKQPYTGHWVMDAHGAFGGGFSGARLQNPGHAAALIGRYNTNPEGCSVMVDPDYPRASDLEAMAR